MQKDKNLPGINSIFPDDLQAYIDQHGEGTYQLIDVRQPEEYEVFHLPGSRLIPLPLLADSLEEIDRNNDVIIYCAVGGRSLMAAQFLAVRGFQKVSHLLGGIEAWEYRTATGLPELHLQFITGHESAEEAAAIAYRFETGLEQFYRAALEGSETAEARDLLQKLIKAEESHKQKLLELLGSLGTTPNDNSQIANVVEGGLKVKDILAGNNDYQKSARICLELAIMIEVQGLDLYLRMAQSCKDSGAKELFHNLGDEEKTHLNLLADFAQTLNE